MMKANKKVMAALLAAMMTVSAGAAVVSADTAVSGPDSTVTDSTASTGWFRTDKKITIDGEKVYGYYYKTGAKTYASGWQMIDGNWYYFAEYSNGNLVVNDANTVNNSKEATDKHYAVVNAVKTIKCADDKKYEFRFDTTGKMITGWYQATATDAVDPTQSTKDGNWEYYNANGAREYGWYKVGANWFYTVNKNTTQLTKKVDGKDTVVTVAAGDLLMNGTYKIGGVWYTFAANGVMVNEGQGWVKDGDNWYYMEAGKRFKGEVLAGRVFTEESWKLINGKYYLFDNTGVMLTGWNKAQNADGKTKWYYSTANGDLVMNNWVQMTNGDWYLVNPSGEMLTGWQVRGGKTYYLNPNTDGTLGSYGVMVTGTRVKVADDMYATFDANGALVSLVNAAGESVRIPN